MENTTTIDDYVKSLSDDASNLHNQGSLLLGNILPIINVSHLSTRSYASSARVKTVDGLLEKIKRKRAGTAEEAPKPEYKLDNITDVIGVRFVTLYKHQISDILEYLMMEILGIDKYKGRKYSRVDFRNIFPDSSIFEAKVYNSDPKNPTVNSWIETINSFTDLNLEKPIYSKYTSIHIIIYYQNIPIEFQIRTVFDDAWAQLNHSFQYSSEKNKTINIEVENPLLINAMLDNLKKFTDACADYADLIYKEAYDGVQDNYSIIHDVGDKQDVIKLLKTHKVPASALRPLTAAFAEMDKAFKFKRENAEDFRKFQTEADALFIQAAELLEKNNELLEIIPNKTCQHLYVYYTLMNQALCYLSCSSVAQHHKAQDLYKAIISKYKEYPMALYRYGQAVEKLGDVGAGFSHIKDALDNAETLYMNSQNEYSDKLLTRDYLHIKGWAPLKLGYIRWFEADEQYNEDESEINKNNLLKQLLEAYKGASSSIELAKQGLMSDNDCQEILRVANNNGLYYASDVLRLHENEDKEIIKLQDAEDWVACIRTHIDFILEKIAIKDWDLNKHNSLARGFYYLGEMDKALVHFDLIIEKASNGGNDVKARYKNDLLYNHIVEANKYKSKILRNIPKVTKE